MRAVSRLPRLSWRTGLVGVVVLGVVLALVSFFLLRGTPQQEVTVDATGVLEPPLAMVVTDTEDNATVQVRYGTNATLMAGVRAGKAGDVLISSDTPGLASLHEKGLVSAPKPIGSDTLAIAYNPPADGKTDLDFAGVIEHGLPIEAPRPGTAYAEVVDEALSTLPADEAQALRALMKPSGGTSPDILADVAAGKAEAGLVLQSEFEAWAHQAPDKRGDFPVEGWLQLGATISYSVAVINPPRDAQVDTAHQDAVAAFVYHHHTLSLRAGLMPAPPTRPYEPPPYTPNPNAPPAPPREHSRSPSATPSP